MKMRRCVVVIVLTFLFCGLCLMTDALAEEKKTDASKESPLKLICAVSEYYACDLDEGCQQVKASDINAQRFFIIDLHEKSVTPVGAGVKKDKKSKIVSMVEVGKMLVLQGVEDGEPGRPDGVGWTASINITNGNMALSASGLDTAFVGLGACTGF